MKPERHVSIGEVKRDLSELVNRVTYGGEHIILTSRGKPKAALISLEDLVRLKQDRAEERLLRWQSWLAHADALVSDIRASSGAEVVDVDHFFTEDRQDLEARDEYRISGRH